jgi:hypothetical protein
MYHTLTRIIERRLLRYDIPKSKSAKLYRHHPSLSDPTGGVPGTIAD